MRPRLESQKSTLLTEDVLRLYVEAHIFMKYGSTSIMITQLEEVLLVELGA